MFGRSKAEFWRVWGTIYKYAIYIGIAGTALPLVRQKSLHSLYAGNAGTGFAARRKYYRIYNLH